MNKLDIIFSNITFALKCNSNLISFGQLKEARISYHNYSESMILKKTKNIINLIQRKKDFFLNLKNNANKIIIIQKRGQPTYLLGKDLELRL